MRAESPSAPPASAPVVNAAGPRRAFVQGALLGVLGVAAGLYVTDSLEGAAVTAVPPPGPAPAADDVAASRAQALAAARLDAVLHEPRTRTRPALPRSDQAMALQAVGQRVGAQGGKVSNPCVRHVGADCAERALEPFFRALDRAGEKTGQARIAVFGNSLIASDRIIDIWRERMQHRFGDAGRGFLLTDRMAPYGGRNRTGVGVRGFETYNIAQGEFGPWPHGLPGVLHFSRGRARARFLLDGAARARLFWLDHGSAPALWVGFDKSAPVEVPPERTGFGRMLALDVPPGAKALEVEVTGGQAVMYGASLERATPGVIVDTLGVVASDSTIFLKEDEALFRQQLSAIAPDLVTVMLGGNEIKRVAWGKSDLATVRTDLVAFLRRIRGTVPSAACLVVGPIENVQGEGRAQPWAPRWQLYAVNRLMKEVALAEGCAHFDLFKAMGGKGALRRLDQRGLLHDDWVHPKGKGLDLPGELVSDALLDAYEASAPLVDERELVARWRSAVPPVSGGHLTAVARHLPGSVDAPAHVAILSAGDEDERLLAGIRRGLRARFGADASGVVAAPFEAALSYKRAATLDVWWRGEGVPRVLRGRSALKPDDVQEAAPGLRRARFGIEGRGTLGLETDTSAVVAVEARRRDVAFAIDSLRVEDGLPLPLLTERRYGLVVASARAADLAERLVGGREDSACLVVRGPSAPSPSPARACGVLEIVEATGGVELWRSWGLVDEQGAFTERGLVAAVDIALAALLDPLDRALDPAGRSG